jgi:putative transposase
MRDPLSGKSTSENFSHSAPPISHHVIKRLLTASQLIRKRFCDLSCFVKELKERFSRWFNKHHERRGTLWMERFKSVLVEDGEALRTMALSIDLNPVRAGLAKDPKDYRWTGYGEATGGNKRARRALRVKPVG